MLWARLLPGVNESSLPGTLWNIGWSHWQQHVPCPAQHLGQVGSARGFLGNLFGKRGLESMGKRWWHQAGAWLSEKGSRQRNPRGRGEVLISADTVCEASSPEIHLPCRHWGLQWDKQLWHYPWKHILYWQLCLSASRAQGEGNIIPQGMVPSFSIGFCSFHAHFEAMGLVEGKRRENVNEQFLNKRFELSLERQRKFSTTFWWAQIEKIGFGKMELIIWFPQPWVVQLWPIQSRERHRAYWNLLLKIFLLGKQNLGGHRPLVLSLGTAR